MTEQAITAELYQLFPLPIVEMVFRGDSLKTRHCAKRRKSLSIKHFCEQKYFSSAKREEGERKAQKRAQKAFVLVSQPRNKLFFVVFVDEKAETR
jgi:hypothetical protein